MHFGFSLPGRGPLARPDALVPLAKKADALRYSSLFVTDHIVIPTSYASAYPYSPTGKVAGDWTQGYLEPLGLMSFLAGSTSRIRLGTSVLVVPYRNPLLTAKLLATLDVLSGGRVILGAGVGWLKEEFEVLGAPPFEERGKVTDEYLRLMRECWTREPVEWKGTYYRMAPVSALPKPAQQGGIPVWVGGHTPGALRRAGQLANGWHPIGMRAPAMLYPDEYRDKVATIHDWARRAGRDPKSITLTFRVPLELLPRRAKPPGGDRLLFRGTEAQVVEDIRAYQALGVSHFVFDLTPQDLRGSVALMERFASDVRPKVLRAEGRPRASGRSAPRPAPNRTRRRAAR
ncbi:MAG TPA: TIGR03619 family F420-dependent LLM class oxidoreductase [Methylomirabilota bacterium]|nr:TIGR03619 family F420-dependent LLM class oxidoreductase [Methylomirabilota bacterium]